MVTGHYPKQCWPRSWGSGSILPRVMTTWCQSVAMSHNIHYSDFTWATWPLKSPTTGIMVEQLFRLTKKKTPKLHITGSSWRESTSDHWIPPQSANKINSVSMSWCHHEKTKFIHWTPTKVIPWTPSFEYSLYIDGLMQGRYNSIANALELRLSCNNLLIKTYTHTWWYQLANANSSILQYPNHH